MTLRLSPEDQAEYDKRLQYLVAMRNVSAYGGNKAEAKKYRQAISAHIARYKEKELPPEPEYVPEPPKFRLPHDTRQIFMYKVPACETVGEAVEIQISQVS